MKGIQGSVWVLLLLLISAPGWADQVLNLHIPGGGAKDLLNMTQIPPEISNAGAGNPEMERSCVDDQGRLVYKSDPQYQHCLAEARAKKAKASNAPPAKP